MWPFSKRLEDVIGKPKKIYVHGVKFLIKKIDTTNYLEGSKVLLQLYDIYKLQKIEQEQVNSKLNKVKEHYRDVFLSSVVYPKLARKLGEPGLLIDNLFTEWDLAHELYAEIISYTLGKKKLIPNTSLEANLKS